MLLNYMYKFILNQEFISYNIKSLQDDEDKLFWV